MGRHNHAMCAMADSIFAFCGILGDDTVTSSIERFSFAWGHQAPRWQIIQVADSLLPRFSLGVAPISATEIAILGGYSDGGPNNDQEGQKLSDVLIFHVKNKIISVAA